MEGISCLLLVLGVVGFSQAVQIDTCSRRPLPVTDYTPSPESFYDVSVTFPEGDTFTPNSKRLVTITVPTDVSVTGFVTQATAGSFCFDDVYAASLRTARCNNANDTLISEVSVQHVEFSWTAPSASSSGNAMAQLYLTLIGDGTYMELTRQLREVNVHDDPREAEKPAVDDDAEVAPDNREEQTGTDEDPNEAEEREAAAREESERRDDDHQLNMEIQLQLQQQERERKLLEEEMLASEGEWTRELEEERRREEEGRRQEEHKYEVLMTEEARALEERIRMEIRDKEEWDRDHPPVDMTPSPPSSNKGDQHLNRDDDDNDDDEIITGNEDEEKIEVDFENEIVKDGQDSGSGRVMSMSASILLTVVCFLIF